MTDVTRRNIAKGAAWSIPAVSVMAAAPSVAASSYSDIDCPAVTWTDTGLKSYSVTSGFTKAYKATFGSNGDAGLGGQYVFNIGQFGPNAPADSNKSAITGFTIKWAGTATVRTANGASGTYKLVGTGTQTAQVIGGPLQQVLTTDTAVPYASLTKKAGNYVQSASFPFTVNFLDGLSNVHSCSSGPTTQLYYNVCYPAKPDGFGNYPNSGLVGNSGAQWSVTVGAPADACS